MSRFLAAVALVALAAPAAAQMGARAWVTTTDRAKLHYPEPVEAGGTQPGDLVIRVDPTKRHQRMVGFGAAITDASAWLIRTKLDPERRAALMRDLFGRDGLGFSFTRVTIGASDFSRRHYSFDDPPGGKPDPELRHFSIGTERDTVVPVAREALAINPDLKVMASPWSPSGWMKTGGSMIGGTLRPEYYAAYAEYFRRTVQAFGAAGVPVAYLSIQNEPDYSPPDYPGMKWAPADRARFVGRHLGPLLAKSREAPAILEWDHNWDKPEQPLAVLADPVARRYVAGVAWHCYGGNVAAQSKVRDAYPDKDVFFTECSGGGWRPGWAAAFREQMRDLVIGSTRHWARGVLMWNLALDEKGDPQLGGCTNCRGVVTIDSRTGAVTRNLEYYALGHASRFVRPGAHRVESSAPARGVHSVAFRNPDGDMVLVALNDGAEPRRIRVQAGSRAFAHRLLAGSASTYIWRD